MPDGLWLTGAGLVCVVVFIAIVARADRRAPLSQVGHPGWGGWLVLTLGVVCIAAGAGLLWSGLFSG